MQVPKSFPNKAAVRDWKKTIKRQKADLYKKHRCPSASPSSQRRVQNSRSRPRKRYQVLSSSPERVGLDIATTQATSKSLSQRLCNSSLYFPANRHFNCVQIALPTNSQKERHKRSEEDSTRDVPAIATSSRPYKVPDSQPSSPVLGQLNGNCDTPVESGDKVFLTACHTLGGLQALSSELNYSGADFAESLEPHLDFEFKQPAKRNRNLVNRQYNISSSSAFKSEAFRTQIALTYESSFSTAYRALTTGDVEQDGQSQTLLARTAPVQEPEILPNFPSRHEVRYSANSRRKVLGPRDPNSQSSPLSWSTTKSTDHTYPNVSNIAQSIESDDSAPPVTTQENLLQARSIGEHKIFSNMASARFSIDSILADAPSRPATAGSVTLRDQLRSARAVSAASTTALRASLETGQSNHINRSPSTIPEPIVYQPPGDSRLEPQIVDLPLQRISAPLSPHAPHKSSKLSSPPQTAEVDHITQLGPPKLDFATYIVPLPLSSRIKDQYCRTIKQYRRSTNAMTTVQRPDEMAVKDVYEMMSRLNSICNHVDLDDKTALSSLKSQQDETGWAVANSTKFQFLQSLLHELRHSDLHVVIVVQAGQLLETVSDFIDLTQLTSFTRLGSEGRALDVRSSASTNRPLKVTLFASDYMGESSGIQLADLVIAFDTSFELRTPLVSSVRRHPIAARLSPIVHLMVYCAVEHIKKCIPTMSSHIEFLKVQTQCVVKTQGIVGELQPEEAKPDAAAEEVAAFVKMGGLDRDWTLFKIRPIQLELQLGYANHSTPPISGSDPYHDASNRKRQVVGLLQSPQASTNNMQDVYENNDVQSKRQRMTPVPEVTHISNSFPPQNNEVAELISDLGIARAALRAEQEAHESTKATLQLLQAQADAREVEVLDQKSALGALQSRYEQLTRDHSALRHEKREAERAAVAVEEKYNAIMADYTAAREDRKAVQQLLEESQTRLESSQVPEIAEFQRLQTENQKLTEEKTAAERRATSAQQDREYAQSIYQEASSSAVEATERVKELEGQLSQCQSLASGEALKLRSANNEDEVKQYEAALEQARAENEDLREQVRRRERGRGMNTRGGSVAPKSPRPGGSPVRSRANSRAPPQGSGSRPVSPIRSALLGGRKGRGTIEQ